MKYLTILTVLLLLGTPLSAGSVYQVVLNTTPLMVSPSAPFSLQFELIDGSGLGDRNNIATLSNFQFAGGAAVAGSTSTTGTVIGDLGSAVTLLDNGFFTVFQQRFTPGNSLSFILNLTTNVDAGGVPDLFSFAILDKGGIEIPTTSVDGALLEINIDSSHPTPLVFGSDPNTPASGGDLLNLAAPLIAPEPGSIVLVLSALAGAGLWYRRSRKSV